ncbi:hypothetical protein L1987_04740 [Smallanthus sonchifolius]|uniref:Uncharacterized protein n=1 Tax=Smallanthus sonchifolius TaxID=185202 RepID=A0ACB9JTE2_9ASTR|nr:hypothetical protein L1987_04740 [Smallanthus sonchifolius]
MFGTLSEEAELKVPASKAWALYGLGFSYCKEKFTKVDNANMIKEAEVVEGGFLDIGFSLYRIRIEIKDTSKDGSGSGSSCLMKLTLEYDVKEEFAANASLVTIEHLVVIMRLANEYLLKN